MLAIVALKACHVRVAFWATELIAEAFLDFLENAAVAV
jgi:hypothetical protein